MEEKLEITNVQELKKGEVVKLPPFPNGKDFVARLKSPSIFLLCVNGQIPNELLQEAQDIYEGKDMQPGRIKQYSEVLIATAKATLIEPKFEDVEEFLSTRQLISIYNYAQAGVRALLPFSEVEKLLENVNSGRKSKQTPKRNNADKR